MYQCRPTGSTKSTWRPRRSSRSLIRWQKSNRLRPSSISTKKSTSLSGRASPRATDPNTRTWCAPCRAAIRRTSSRLPLMISSIPNSDSSPILQLHDRVRWEALDALSEPERHTQILETLKKAAVRWPERKAPYVAENFRRIRAAGGPRRAKQHLESLSGADRKIQCGYLLDSGCRHQWSSVGRAPSPAAGPLAGPPVGGRGRPPRSRGTAPQGRSQSRNLSQVNSRNARNMKMSR